MIIALIGTGCGFILGLVVGGIKAIRLDLTSSKASRIFKKIIDYRLEVWQRSNGDPAKSIFCETLPRIRARRAVQGMLTED